MGSLGSSALSLLLGAAGTLVTLYLTYLFNRYTKSAENYRKEREDKEALERKKKEEDDTIILTLLRIELKYVTEQIQLKGFYTSDERKRYGFMYAVYKERGGNGEVERGFLSLDDLPYEKK